MKNLKELIRQAAKEQGYKGVVHLSEEAALDYRKTVRVWNGDPSAKLAHVRQILSHLGYQLKAVKNNG